jgi:hypothetical protein
MSHRNFYIKRKNATAGDILMKQYKILKDEGFMLSEKEYQAKVANGDSDVDNYVMLSDDHPITRHFARHYYNKRYKQYLEDSTGLDIGKISNDLFGKGSDLSKVVTQTTKFIHGNLQLLRGAVLNLRASSYINSAVSSSIIYGLHAENPHLMVSYISKAKKHIDSYRKQLVSLIRAEQKLEMAKAAGKSADEISKLTQSFKTIEGNLKANPVHGAFESGLGITIRSDAYKTGTYDENFAILKMKKWFGKDVGERFATLLTDPSTKIGNTVGKIYDATELYPKVALYLDKLDATGSADIAAQTVLMAFPTYNNLSPMWNAIDNVSPYTKYMVSMPKMFLYAVDQHPFRFGALHASALILPPMTWDSDEQREKYEGFMNIGFDQKWWYESAYPYYMPSKSFNADMMSLGMVFDPLFIVEGWSGLFDLTPTSTIK